ncbi:hypothetical protein Tco_0242104 [Tanacetum coccineum]
MPREETMMKPGHQDLNALDSLKLWKKFCFHKFITSSCYGKAAIERRKLCHEFYSTYKFDEVCADDGLQTKKIIKFRLCGRAHSFTLLEFARWLGLYHSDELDEEGFNVYFEGGLRSDEHFNTQEYWLSISREENLSLSKSHASTIRYLVLRVVHKMITYGLCQRTTGWMKRKGAGTQRESQICCRQFITNIARKARVLIDDVIRSVSAPIYYRYLDTAKLKGLIDSKGLGAYNPPGYAQPQYDQYCQQYPPPSQYHQQQPNDDE